MRLNLTVFLSSVLLTGALGLPARAELLVTIDKDAQRMTVAVDGETRHTWPVSTGTDGYDTPGGTFKPFRMEAKHFSREWDNAPMPHAIFFSQVGHAIHGTTQTRHLGRPASHGCVRLSPRNAATLFALVKSQKMANTRVVIEGSASAVAARGTPGVRAARRRPSYEEGGLMSAGMQMGRGGDAYYPARSRRAYRDPFDRGYDDGTAGGYYEE